MSSDAETQNTPKRTAAASDAPAEHELVAESEAPDPDGSPAKSGPTAPKGAPAATTPSEPTDVQADSQKQQSNQGSDTKKRTRPQTITELIEHAYREAGRKLNLTRDLTNLTVDPDASQAEIKLVRQLAADDQLLAVPPSLLAALAEIETKPPARQRVLELVLVAFADHKLFQNKLERLNDPRVEPPLTAREISSAAKTLMIDAVSRAQAPERRTAIRERLRVNAVTAFELFRVLRDGWTSDQFVEDMCGLIWDAPIQRSASKMAALLATAKNTDALSQLSRHFELRLRDSQRETAEARGRAAQQERRAEAAEARGSSLSADLEAERSRVAELQSQADDLAQRLTAEQSSRVVDKSHLVDDYEALRTQIVRQLTAQVEILGDGLHALQKGRTAVAEEFVDRALTKIDGEVKRLKQLDGGQR
jgi:hypothetical protein